MSDLEANKLVIDQLIRVVWEGGDLSRLAEFWTADAVNHADPAGVTGLSALYAYHAGFAEWMSGLSETRIEVARQVAEDDLVVSHLVTHARHSGIVEGLPPSGRHVHLVSMRIDRLIDQKIAEHWSVADLAGFTSQLTCGGTNGTS